MSLLAACRSCLRQRFTELRHRYVVIRHKTYGQKVAEPKVESVDVLVYRHNHSFHVGIVMACLAMFGWFLYSTAITFQAVGENLQRTQKGKVQEGERYGRFKIDMFTYKEGKHHRIFASAFFFLMLIPLLAVVYIPPRYIRAVVLLKDGRNVCLKTYVPFGPSKYVTIPLDQLHSYTPYQPGNPCFVKRVKGFIPFYLSGKGEVMDAPKLEIVLNKEE